MSRAVPTYDIVVADAEYGLISPAETATCPSPDQCYQLDIGPAGVVAGCGDGAYCPGAEVTRAQIAVFLLKTLEGADYTPPNCTGVFPDVTCPSLFAAWVEDLYARGITGGCGTEPLAYCPAQRVNRQQMAVFVTRTFGLTLVGL